MKLAGRRTFAAWFSGTMTLGVFSVDSSVAVEGVDFSGEKVAIMVVGLKWSI